MIDNLSIKKVPVMFEIYPQSLKEGNYKLPVGEVK